MHIRKDIEYVDIDVCTEEGKQIFDKYVSTSQPIVIRGTVQNWPAWQLWKDLNYLESKIPADTPIPVRTNFHISRPDEWLGETANVSWTQFYNHWKQNKEWKENMDPNDTFYYLASLPMNKHFQTLCNDVIVPLHPKEQNKSGNLWLGNTGQITHVHYDWSTGDPGMDGLHAVVKGRKKFLLFDPALNVDAFPRVKIWGRFHNSIVGKSGLPDENQFPEFENAVCYEIDLQAGDLLFIPKLWWHHVTTLEPSISVNFWFQHLGSEKLKLTKHWPHMAKYLSCVQTMEITKEKMKNVLQFYGLKVTDEDVDFYMNNKLEFIKLPQFIETFANGTRAPWMKSQPESQVFAKEICDKVREWARERENKTN